MRKIFRIIALTLVCLIALSALTSCGRMFEGVQRKATKAGFTSYLFNHREMAEVNTAMHAAGISGEMKTACLMVDDTGDSAYLYEFDKISAARSFMEKYTEIIGIYDGDIELRRDNKIVIAGSSSAVDRCW